MSNAKKLRMKLIIGGTILVAAIGYLAYAGIQKGWVYYVEVDAFLATPEFHQQRVRLCGRVASENVDAGAGRTVAKFDLLGRENRIPIFYRGVLPDMFKPGCDVVLEGKLDAQGVFQADVMMTKCSSKYQAEEHAKRLEVK